MRAISLQSGSNGNCVFLECGETRLLFDAGISGLSAQTRLAVHGIDIRTVDAVLISHDHSDHVSCAGVLHRKFGLGLWMTEKTHAVIARYKKLGRVGPIQHIPVGGSFRIKNVTVETLPTPHDAADGVCFAVDDGTRRFGVCTDLGHVFSGLPDFIASLDGVLLESNFDPYMLENGPYPEDLIARVSGKHGHISNFEAAELLKKHGKRLKQTLLGHISAENNNEPLVEKTHREILGKRFSFCIASRYGASEMVEIK